MSEQVINIRLPRLHPSQAHVERNKKRYTVLCCGRRWGKTSYILYEVAMALLQGKRVAYVAPASTDNAYKAVWRDVQERLKPITKKSNQADKTLTLINGGHLALYTFNAIDRLRGDTKGWDVIALDEVAFAPNLNKSWGDVIRPALADKQGRAFISSTPKGLNDFYAIYQRGVQGENDWASFRYPSMANPYIPPSEWGLMESELTASTYQQEILAEFVEGAGAVFRDIGDVSTLEERAPYDGRIIFGVDWGRDNDYTVISIIDADTRQQVGMTRFNKIGWDVQRARLKALYEAWQPMRVVAEENSVGGVNIEALRLDGIPVMGFTTTMQSKRQIIDSLSLAIEKRDILLLNTEIQKNELMAYAQRKTSSGNYQFGAPSGAHDDTVMALAIAWWGVQNAVLNFDMLMF